MTRSSLSDGRLDYFEWASRLTHSEHEKAQSEFMSRVPRYEPRAAPTSDADADADAAKASPDDE